MNQELKSIDHLVKSKDFPSTLYLIHISFSLNSVDNNVVLSPHDVAWDISFLRRWTYCCT